MTVLQKKIARAGKTEGKTPINPNLLNPCHQSLLECLEQMIPLHLCHAGSVGVNEFSLSHLIKPKKHSVLIYGYGCTKKQTDMLIVVRPELVECVNNFSFGVETNRNKKNKDQKGKNNKTDTMDLSPIDFLMMQDFPTVVAQFVNTDLYSEKSDDLGNIFKSPVMSTDFSKFVFAQKQKNFIAYDLKFHVKSQATKENEKANKNTPKKSETIDTVISVIFDEAFYRRLSPKEQFPDNLSDDELPVSLAQWKEHLREYRVPLRVLAETLQMTIADCTRLELGQEIPLPGVALNDLVVSIDLKSDRKDVAVGALGIYKSSKAIKIIESRMPDFAQGYI